MRGDEGLGKHAPDRDVERARHAFLLHARREAAQGHLPRLGERGERGRGDEPAEALAVARRERDRDEAAEAVAEDVGLARQGERVEEAGDALGVMLDVGAGGRRGAVAGQAHERDAVPAREQRHHAVERAALGEQRMQQHEVAPRAELLHFHFCCADLDDGHRDRRIN